MLLAFYLDGMCFGVDVLKVHRVIRNAERSQDSERAEQNRPHGLGEPPVTIDLRRRLGLPSRAADDASMMVVVGTRAGLVELPVDEIGEVVEVQKDQAAQAPPTINGRTTDVVAFAYRLPDRLLLVLDIDRAAAG